jgi:hypothetical protein
MGFKSGRRYRFHWRGQFFSDMAERLVYFWCAQDFWVVPAHPRVSSFFSIVLFQEHWESENLVLELVEQGAFELGSLDEEAVDQRGPWTYLLKVPLLAYYRSQNSRGFVIVVLNRCRCALFAYSMLSFRRLQPLRWARWLVKTNFGALILLIGAIFSVIFA